MIIVKVQGGLGNQMFQYATAKALGKNKDFYLDLFFLESNIISNDEYTARQLELDIFKNVGLKIANVLIAKVFKSTKFYLPKIRPFFKINKITDENFSDLSVGFKNLYLDGYFQNPLNFDKIRPQLIEDFTFPALTENLKQYEKEIKMAKNPVAIHVRRGDYLKPINHSILPVLALSYYEEAVNKILETVKNPIFFIFSDDMNWCKTNFEFIKAKKKFMPATNKNWEDMFLMCICNHNIIANSSFSWWGAWLNQNPNKIIIAPKKWHHSTKTNIIPEEWISL